MTDGTTAGHSPRNRTVAPYTKSSGDELNKQKNSERGDLMTDLDPVAPEAAGELYLDHRQDEVSKETLKSHRYRLEQFAEGSA